MDTSNRAAINRVLAALEERSQLQLATLHTCAHQASLSADRQHPPRASGVFVVRVVCTSTLSCSCVYATATSSERLWWWWDP